MMEAVSSWDIWRPKRNDHLEVYRDLEEVLLEHLNVKDISTDLL
jgi:hypothetical protein